MKNRAAAAGVILLISLLSTILVFSHLFEDRVFKAISFLIFVLFPLYSLLIGLYAGMAFPCRWGLITVLPLYTFIAAMWKIGVDPVLFFAFSASYFGISLVAMLLTHFIRKKWERKREEKRSTR